MNKTHAAHMLIALAAGILFSGRFGVSQQPARPAIGVVDYGSVILSLDRIRVYRDFGDGMQVSNLTDGERMKVRATMQDVGEVIDELMTEHGLRVVLRVESSPPGPKCGCFGPGLLEAQSEAVEQPPVTHEEHRRRELERLLGSGVVKHKDVDLTGLVVQRMEGMRRGQE